MLILRRPRPQADPRRLRLLGCNTGITRGSAGAGGCSRVHGSRVESAIWSTGHSSWRYHQVATALVFEMSAGKAPE